MTRTTPRSRRHPLLAVVILATAGALATPSVGLASSPSSAHAASTHHSSKRVRRRTRRRPRPVKPLTNAQIIALIKKNELPGPAGAQGPAGANGSSAGYAAIGNGGPVGGSNAPTVVVSKGLPAGNFIINAKVVLSGTTTNNEGPVAIGECDLMSSSSSLKLDSAQWDQPLSSLAGGAVFLAATTLATQAAQTFAAPTSVSLQCFSSSPSVTLTASFASLQAVQVATGG